jgi:flagellar biosynthesis protein FliQ
MSVPLVMPREQRSTSFRAAVRFAMGISLTVSVWALLVGFAVAVFSLQATWNSFDIVQKEVLGFAYAFSVAGTITGVVASATFGDKQRAIVFGLIGGVLLAVSVPALRWLIYRLTAPNLAWADREWDGAVECIGLGLALGTSLALAVSGLVHASGLLARHLALWRFGILIAIVVAILGQWLLPVTISYLSDLVIPYLRWHYGFRYDEALRGAGIGAGPGALAGAIVSALIARWLGASRGLRRQSA